MSSAASAPAERLARHTAYNGIAQFLPQLVGLVTIPFLLGALGPAAYGVWALVNTVVVVFVTLDGGISVSAQRFYALYAAQQDDDRAARLTASAGVALIGLTGVLFALGGPFAALVLAVTELPAEVVAGADYLFRRIGIVVGLLLVGNLLLGYLRAHSRFGLIAVATALSQAALCLVLWLHRDGLTLPVMFLVLVAQLGTNVVVMALGAARHLASLRWRFAAREQLSEFWAYASRSLVVNVSGLALLQAGPIFVAAFAPIEQVGFLGVAGQLASAVRSFPMFALPPVLTVITRTFGSDGATAAVAKAGAFNRVWVPAVVGYASIAAAGMWFVARGFAGALPVAQAAAVLLTVGYACNLVTGVSTACTNAIGRPGLGARYSAVSAIATVLVTGPVAFVGGAVGAAVAVLLVQAGSLGYFLRLLRREVPDLDRGSALHLPAALASGALTVAAGWLSLTWGPRSPAALVAALAAVGIGFLGYAVLGRRWLAQARALTGRSG